MGSGSWCLPVPTQPPKLMGRPSRLTSARAPSRVLTPPVSALPGLTPLTSLGLPQLGLSGCPQNTQVTGPHLPEQPFHLGQCPAQQLTR